MIRVKLFGAFRSQWSAGVLELPFAEPCTLSALRAALAERLDPELLRVSAFGTDSEILGENARVHPGQTVALLPPVCGG